MALTKTNAKSAVPALRLADEKIIDSGKLRFGDSAITAEFPPLRRPDSKIVDPGIVRLGDSAITARFPARK